MVRRSLRQELPEEVYVVGIPREPEDYHTPVRDEQSGLGLSTLTVLDAEGSGRCPCSPRGASRSGAFVTS